MFARINAVAFSGIDVQRVDVQAQISNGLPAFTKVGYIKAALLVLMFLMLGSPPSYAWSCLSIPPTTDLLIKAPVIFSGIAVSVGEKDVQTAANGVQKYKYVNFKVTRMFKGPDVENLELLIVRPGYSYKIGEEVTLIPDVGKSGIMHISDCEIGMRSEIYWVGKIKKAYDTPFPNLYLRFTDLPHKKWIFLIVSLIFLVLAVFYEKCKARESN